MLKRLALASLLALSFLALTPSRLEAWVAFHAGYRARPFYHVGPYIGPYRSPYVGPYRYGYIPYAPPVVPPIYRPYPYPYAYGYRVAPYGPVVYRPGVYRVP